MRDQCQLAAAHLRCEPRSHAVDGLARSDATDRSPLHSGTKPGTQGGSRRYRARYEARYTVAQGGTRQHVQVCCQAVRGAEEKHPCGRSQRAEAEGYSRRLRKLYKLSSRLGGGGRGRRALPFPPIGRCRRRGIVHTKQRCSYAALPARISGARK